MSAISKIVLIILSSVCCFSQTKVAGPNWNVPHYDVAAESERDHILQTTMPSDRIEFSFKLPLSERTTSAAVYDTSGRKVRTLWMNRAYDKGEYREIWDGKDDYGAKATPANYTIKLGYNNITYTWDGIIGNTESSWSSYRSWSGIVPSFIRSLAFVNGKAYSANGYNEGGYAGAVFAEATPNSDVTPITKLIFSTLQHFMFSATDGKLIYFGFQTFSAQRNPAQGVIAFTPSGDYYRFEKGAQYPSFPKSTATFWNDATIPPTGIPDVRVADMSPYPSAAITGVAVQRNGQLLATAHGFYQPGGKASTPVPSANEIRLSDKSTGASVGSFSIPNPQGMAFDLQNNLWVISGYGVDDKLYRITDVGRTNVTDSPIQGLSNPMSVSVNPNDGTVFVADGGVSQQIKQFDPKTGHVLSALGVKGGYLANGACNSNVTHDTFWFDPGPNMNQMPVISTNTPFVSWVSVADNGNVWVGDFSTSRILHFAKAGSGWKYVNRVMYLPWARGSSVPLAQPSRVFGGPTGFLEFKVDYSVALRSGDPDLADGNHSWELVRNWLPCYLQQDKSADLANEMAAYSFPNGSVIGAIFSHTTSQTPALLKLDENGLLKVKRIAPLPKDIVFDKDGSYYRSSVESKASMAKVTFKKYPIVGYDNDGFPNWYLAGQPMASYEADHSHGEPVAREQAFTHWPSSNGVIPIFDVEKNFDIQPAGIAFHMGGLSTNASHLSWMSMPEKNIAFTDGEGSFPAADVRRKAHMGAIALTIDDNIFALQNGNGSPWSCQFYQFKDNGLFVGQFGFQTSADYLPTNVSWKVTGFPQKGTEQQLAPGECSDENHFNAVRVKQEYYLYLGDESYHKGIHRWKVSNLQTYGELTGNAALGKTSLILQ